ncbi:MAG TPA: Pr6Pr family membrane protein, partial [Brevundimonas sp.]|nr:Pr6Pr family membrane protein [Brevundimonas sp.]
AKGRLRWIDAGKWLMFPLLYGGWTLLHGAVIGWYPYWFIDVSSLGLGGALLNFAGLLIFFALVGLLVVAIDRTLGQRDTGPRAA